MILGIFIGVLLWQLLALIIYVITKEDEEKALSFGVGVWGLILKGFFQICDHIRHFIKVRKYVAMLLDPEGYPCYCKDNEAFSLVEGAGYEWNYAIKHNYSIEDGWKKKYCPFGVPNIKYTPISIAKAEGAYKVSRETISKVIREGKKINLDDYRTEKKENE